MHTGKAQKLLLKRRPSAARESMCSVLICRLPIGAEATDEVLIIVNDQDMRVPRRGGGGQNDSRAATMAQPALTRFNCMPGQLMAQHPNRHDFRS